MDENARNQGPGPDRDSGGGNSPKNHQTILVIVICLLVSLMVMGLLNNALGGMS